MPTHIHLGFEEMTDAMRSVQKLSELGKHYGIEDIFSDNGGRLLQILVATGLDRVPGRGGPDAKDRMGREYEIKSLDANSKVSGFGTSHHLNNSTIDRYREHTFVFAVFEGIMLREIYRVRALDLEPLFDQWTQTLWSQSHINNPKIPLAFVREVGEIMYMKDVPAPWTPLGDGKKRRTRPYRYAELVKAGLVKAA